MTRIWCTTVLLTLGGASAALAWPSLPSLPGQEGFPERDSMIEVGARAMSGNRSSSKFSEYRDYRPGVFGNAFIHDESKDHRHFTELTAVNPGYDDTQVSATYGKYGTFELNLSFDELPHDFSDTARSLYSAVSPGRLVLPPGLQAFIADGGVAKTQSARLQAALNTAPVVPLGFEQKNTTFSGTYQPSRNWVLSGGYTRMHKDGTRPFGMATGSPGGSFIQVAAPIDQDVHDVRSAVQYRAKDWNATLGYWGSFFRNHIDSLTIDNPLSAVDTATAEKAGRTDLEPNNSYNSVSLTGMHKYDFGWPARLSGTVSFGRRRQNDFFLPQTDNTAIKSPLLALPTASLNGQADTRLANIVFTGRPAQDFDFTGRYRMYELRSDTPDITFPAHVVNDSSLTIENRTTGGSEASQYIKRNASMDGYWRISDPLTARIGYEHEDMNRPDHREVNATREDMWKAGIDWRPDRGNVWLIRTDYQYGARTGTPYDTLAHFHVVLEEDATGTLTQQLQLQSPLLRKFDEANRTQNKATVYTQYTPRSSVSMGLSASYALSAYDSSPLGLQSDERFSVGTDSTWRMSDRASWTGFYSYENIHARQLSEFRTVTGAGATAVIFDGPLNDWNSTSTDRINTFGGTFRYAIKPGKWDTSISWVRELAHGSTVTGAVPGSNVPKGTVDNGVPFDFPEIEDQLDTLSMLLRHHLNENTSLQFEYRYEHFSEVNYKVDGLQPFNPFSNVNQALVVSPSTDVFLGDQLNNYNVHVFQLSAMQRF